MCVFYQVVFHFVFNISSVSTVPLLLSLLIKSKMRLDYECDCVHNWWQAPQYEQFCGNHYLNF